MKAEPLPFKPTGGARPWAPGRLYRHPDGDVVCGDALAFLNSLRDASADIIFLDPPFNLGKRYGRAPSRADRLDDSAYYAYMWQVLQRSAVVLRPGGSLFLYHVPRWALTLSDV